MGHFYVVIRNKDVFERIHQVNAGHWVIGRDECCEIRLPDRAVSRKHAALRIEGRRCRIRDLGSRNGTCVNGRALSSEEELLENGAELLIGPYLLNICFSPADVVRKTEHVEESTLQKRIQAGSDESVVRDKLPLKPSQHRVFLLLLEGMMEKEIASHLGITINTVHTHAKAIYKALRVSSRGELFSRWLSYRKFQ